MSNTAGLRPNCNWTPYQVVAWVIPSVPEIKAFVPGGQDMSFVNSTMARAALKLIAVMLMVNTGRPAARPNLWCGQIVGLCPGHLITVIIWPTLQVQSINLIYPVMLSLYGQPGAWCLDLTYCYTLQVTVLPGARKRGSPEGNWVFSDSTRVTISGSNFDPASSVLYLAGRPDTTGQMQSSNPL